MYKLRVCFLSAVRAAGPRHKTRTHYAALHQGVGPGAAQAAAHHPGRQSQLRAAGQAEESAAQGAPQGGQNHRRLDFHRRNQHRSVFRVKLHRPL